MSNTFNSRLLTNLQIQNEQDAQFQLTQRTSFQLAEIAKTMGESGSIKDANISVGIKEFLNSYVRVPEILF